MGWGGPGAGGGALRHIDVRVSYTRGARSTR